MINKYKKIISTILLCSMILTTNGFMTLADSIDETVAQTTEATQEQTEEQVEEQTEEVEQSVEQIEEQTEEQPTEQAIKKSSNSEIEEDLEEEDEEVSENIEYEEEPEEDEVIEVEEEIATDSELDEEEEIEENVLYEPEEDEEEIATESETDELIELEEEINEVASESEVEVPLLLSLFGAEEIEESTESEIISVKTAFAMPKLMLAGTPLLGGTVTNTTWDTSKSWADAYMYRKTDDWTQAYISNSEYTGSDLLDIFRYCTSSSGKWEYRWRNKDGDICDIYTGTASCASKNLTIDVIDDIDISCYEYFFAGNNKEGVKEINGIEHIQVTGTGSAAVTNLSYMFYGYQASEDLDLSHFDTSAVTTTECMFNNAYKITSIDLTGWNLSNVTTYKYMFGHNTELVSIYIDPTTFAINSSGDFTGTFEGCNNLIGLNGTEAYDGYDSDTNKTYFRIDVPDEGTPGNLTTKVCYEVKFDSEATQIASQSVLWGTKATQPANPSHDDYVFKGWCDTEDEDTTYDWDTLIKANTTIYVKWNPIYEVEFQIDSLGTQPSSQRKEKGSLVTNPGNLSETGYTFDGWYKDYSTFNTQWDFSVATVSENPTNIYAKWTENTYTITYYPNGGVWDATDSVIRSREYTESVILETGITKEGYTFAGWYENNSFSGSAITDIAANTNKNTIVYAKWTENPYNIVYANLNGGTWTSGYTAPTTRYYRSAVTLPTSVNIYRTGYSFAGWYENADFSGSVITRTESYTTKVYNLYAKWDIINYDLIVNLGGGSWVGSYIFPTSQTRNINTAKITLATAGNIEKTGNTFNGWYDNSSYSGSVYTEVGQGTYLQNLNFYAKWTPNTYNINYHLEVATVSGTTIGTATIRSGNIATYTYGNNPITLTSDVVYDGYRFLGWYLNSSWTGSQITTINSTDLGNKDLYGKWEKVPTYTMSFNNGGGSGSKASIVMTENVETIIPGNPFSRSNYSFAGWKGSNGTSYSVNGRYVINQDITLIAQWSYNTPSYSGGGGSGGGGGGGGGGTISTGQTQLGVNPLTAETPEQLQSKISNAPATYGTYLIIGDDGKSGKTLETEATSTTKFKWYKDEKTGSYFMYNIGESDKIDFVSGWAFIEYNKNHRFYYFDPVSSKMKTGFYNDPTTKKTYLFNYDINSAEYGSMITNQTVKVGTTNFIFNEKGELTGTTQG